MIYHGTQNTGRHPIRVLTRQLVFTTRIAGSSEIIFDLIADMPNYGRWLSGSKAFGATTEVTPYPVRLGTTYLDAGSLGERPGEVTEFERPTRIAFHHTMRLKKGPLRGELDIQVHYTLESAASATSVIRTLEVIVRLPALLKLAEPLVLHGLRRENVRILAELKRYVETCPNV
jgi:uncharacterized protein YndB with AHSA1/START domain